MSTKELESSFLFWKIDVVKVVLLLESNRLVAIRKNESRKLNNSLTLFITIVKMITVDFRNEDAPWLTTH
jgi:hypothetical protein